MQYDYKLALARNSPPFPGGQWRLPFKSVCSVVPFPLLFVYILVSTKRAHSMRRLFFLEGPPMLSHPWRFAAISSYFCGFIVRVACRQNQFIAGSRRSRRSNNIWQFLSLTFLKPVQESSSPNAKIFLGEGAATGPQWPPAIP